MKQRILLLAAGLMMLASVAHAEIPDAVLNQEYQSCTANQNDPDRNAYCACVRDGMRDWDEKTFEDVAQAAVAANGAQQPPPAKLEELAKACISKVMH